MCWKDSKKTGQDFMHYYWLCALMTLFGTALILYSSQTNKLSDLTYGLAIVIGGLFLSIWLSNASIVQKLRRRY